MEPSTLPAGVIGGVNSGLGGVVKQVSDVYTLDLFGKPGRGRPRKPDALTPAQRAKAYRARKAANGDQFQWLRDAYLELCRDSKPGLDQVTNFRDASQKFESGADLVESEPWYFPGTPEWHAQQVRLGRVVTGKEWF